MFMITLKQEIGSHLFKVIQNGEIIDHCDLVAAEEIAVGFEEQGMKVSWLYPEDSRNEKRNA